MRKKGNKAKQNKTESKEKKNGTRWDFNVNGARGS